RRILEGKHSLELRLEAARVIQMALGDVAGDEETAAVFSNYAPAEDLTPYERALDPLRIAVAKLFPTGDRPLDLELSRLASMIAPANDQLLGKLLDRLTSDSHPVDDIHYLIVAARIPFKPGQAQREKIVRALLQLEGKLGRHGLHKDSNWNAR